MTDQPILIDQEQWDKLFAYAESIGALVEYPTTSPSVDKLCPAMCRAQAEIKRAKKDSENPFYKSQYADLSSVMDACMVPLNKHGLFVMQPPALNRAGEPVLITRLMHESGQWLQGVIKLGAAKPAAEVDEGPKIPGTDKKKDSNTVQKTVAEITYLRRACLSALVGVAADDDDGNEAEGAPQQRAPQRPQAPPPAPGGAPRIGPR